MRLPVPKDWQLESDIHETWRSNGRCGARGKAGAGPRRYLKALVLGNQQLPLLTPKPLVNVNLERTDLR
jgi:hypothetical protein